MSSTCLLCAGSHGSVFFDVFRWLSEILIICTFFRVSFRLFRADLPAWSDLALTESFQILNARVLRLQCLHHRNPRSFHLHTFENPNGDFCENLEKITAKNFEKIQGKLRENWKNLEKTAQNLEKTEVDSSMHTWSLTTFVRENIFLCGFQQMKVKIQTKKTLVVDFTVLPLFSYFSLILNREIPRNWLSDRYLDDRAAGMAPDCRFLILAMRFSVK